MNKKEYEKEMERYTKEVTEYILDMKKFYAKSKFDIEKVKGIAKVKDIQKMLDDYFIKPLTTGSAVNVSIIKTLLFLLYQVIFSQTPEYEIMYVLGFTKNFYLNEIDIPYVGNKMIKVDVNSFLKKLEYKGVEKYIIAHNHEIKPEPSDLDLKFTENLAKASEKVGIELLDHVILTPNDVFSFREHFYDFKRILTLM